MGGTDSGYTAIVPPPTQKSPTRVGDEGWLSRTGHGETPPNVIPCRCTPPAWNLRGLAIGLSFISHRAHRGRRGVLLGGAVDWSATLPTSCFLLPTSLAHIGHTEGTEPCWLIGAVDWCLSMRYADLAHAEARRHGAHALRPHLLPRAHTPPSAYPMASRGDSTLRLPSQPAWNDARGGVHAEGTHPPSVIP